MGWIALVWDIFLRTLKGIFGTDKPAVTEVQNAKPEIPLPVPADSVLLGELGLRRDNARPSDENGVHSGLSGQAPANSGKPEGDGARP